MKTPTIKLSSPATREFWEIPVVFEDDQLLALNKPSRLLTSPDRYDPTRPNLMRLLHESIARGVPWAASRGLTYLMNAHRLDFETSGIILLAKTKPILVALANLFSTDKPSKTYIAFVAGTPPHDTFEVEAKIGPHPGRVGQMRVDSKHGKRARTEFSVRERFHGCTLLECRPITGRTHQIRVHLRYRNLPILGDRLYGGRPLYLSKLKSKFHLKEGEVERPLLGVTALHAERLALPHPLTGLPIEMTAEWPKDLKVALKYLQRYAGLGGRGRPALDAPAEPDPVPPPHSDDSGAPGPAPAGEAGTD